MRFGVFLGALEEMVAEKDVYGLLVLDRSEATIGLLKGKRIVVLLNKQSLVPSKHDAGGQSQRRFERGTEVLALQWLKQVGELASKAFLVEKNLRGIIVGGPGYTKRDFVKDEHLHYELRSLVLPNTIDLEYTDEYGLKQLVHYARDALLGLSVAHEEQLMERLLEEIRRPSGGLAIYGEQETERALERGAIDILLLSEKLPFHKLKSFGGRAEALGTTVEMVSVDTDVGRSLLSTFGGAAGFLRYR